jgi:hypothetical protein
VEIRLTPEAGENLKAAVQVNQHVLSQATSYRLINSLKIGGLSRNTAQTLIHLLQQVFKIPATTTPNSSSLQLPKGQLVASTKALKLDSTIAQKNTVITVNVDKLQEAIDIYNEVVLESDSETIKQLAKNPDFVEIGQALKELRSVINN